MAVPILMYHSVRENPPPETAPLCVSPGAFRDQMALLAAEGYTPLPLSAVEAGVEAVKPVCVTFDDGYADLHSDALPILTDFGFPATVFVTTGWLDDAGSDAAGRPLDRMLTWAHVRELTAHGIEVGAHSHSHPQLDQLRDGALRDELTRSRLSLEDRVQSPVTTMAYPYGYSSERVRRFVAGTGYTTAYAVANEMADPVDGYAIPRLTVQASTSLETFRRIVEGRHGFVKEKALTKGYAMVRRSRYAYRKAMHRD